MNVGEVARKRPVGGIRVLEVWMGFEMASFVSVGAPRRAGRGHDE